ncbi:MAG: OmpP1/FadL family transporter, partial [Vibrio sp.]
MYPQKNICRGLAISLVALASQSAFAGGYQLNAQSAKGLGRAFAGDAVIADDASAMARNAAAMALFDRDSLSFGLTIIDTDITVKDGTYNSLMGQSSDTSYDQAGDTSYAPNFYYIHPINDKWAVGFDAFSNFGTKTEFDDSFNGTEYGGLTDVKSVNLGAALSYRVNDHWSIGGGVDVIYGKGELKRDFEMPKLLGGNTITALDVDADGWAVGANIGTVLELDDNNRFGLSYRFSPKLEADGDISVGGAKPEADTLKLPLPDIVEFSGYHKLNPSFAMHYSVQYVSWNEFDTLDTENLGAIKKYDWVD